MAGMRPSARASPICSRRWAIASAREYYINDAGRQMEILAASTWLRYLERCGERFAFPANGYRGDYISAIAASCMPRKATAGARAAEVFADCRPTSRKAATRTSTSMRSSPASGAHRECRFPRVLDTGAGGHLADIREDLARIRRAPSIAGSPSAP